MTLESQVVSPPLAQRLKELGFEQKSHFKYMEANGQYVLMDGFPVASFVSAFTTSELGEMIPTFSCSKTDHPTERFPRYQIIHPQTGKHTYADTLLDAMALMLIHLKENGLI